MHCLEKVPVDRPATARQLAEQLEAFLAGRSVPVRKPASRARGAHRRVRRWAFAATGVGVVFCLAFGVWLFKGTEPSRYQDSKQESAHAGAGTEETDDLVLEDLPGEQGEEAKGEPGKGGKPDLYTLCVGFNDHSQLKGGSLADLNYSRADAEAMARALQQQQANALYRRAQVDRLLEKDVTVGNIVLRLKKISGKVRRDDWFVLFLSGNGFVKENDSKVGEPGTYSYLCFDSNIKDPRTMLTSRQLYDLLAHVPCRKLLVLDTCQSGDVASTPLRDLTRGGMPFVVFCSCERAQEALEPVPGEGRYKQGFFTQCLLEALGSQFKVADTNEDGTLDIHELTFYVKKRMPEILKEYKQPANLQTPLFFLSSSALPFASDPAARKKGRSVSGTSRRTPRRDRDAQAIEQVESQDRQQTAMIATSVVGSRSDHVLTSIVAAGSVLHPEEELKLSTR
jgi:hypothetical protein